MDFLIVGWRKDFEQSGWAVGYCKHCGRHEAIRIGREVTTVTLYHLVRLGRNVGEEVSYCDACWKPARPRGDQAIPVANWSYKDGLAALFKACAPDLVADVPQFTSDDDLRAILRLVRRRSSLDEVDISFGLFTGMWIGALLAIPFGFSFGLPGDPHPIRIAALSGLAGGFLGSVIGAIVGGLRQTRAVARELMAMTYHKYQLPSERLLALASSFPRRVRNAVTLAVGPERWIVW